MKISFDNLNEGERQLVKWQYRLHGDFKTALWRSITLADERNLDRLAKGFPVEVEAYRRFAGESGYWADVQARAGVMVGA